MIHFSTWNEIFSFLHSFSTLVLDHGYTLGSTGGFKKKNTDAWVKPPYLHFCAPNSHFKSEQWPAITFYSLPNPFQTGLGSISFQGQHEGTCWYIKVSLDVSEWGQLTPLGQLVVWSGHSRWLFSCCLYIPCMTSVCLPCTLLTWLTFLHTCPRPQLVIVLIQGAVRGVPLSWYPW